MPISFTAAERKAVTRRQLNIQLENDAFASSADALAAEQLKLLDVDGANKAFYVFYRQQVTAYELEARQVTGKISADYTDGTISPYTPGDLSDSAKTPGGTLFFPATPVNIYFIPQVVLAINGYTNFTGLDARYELNILTNANIPQGLTETLNILLNGITGAMLENINATGSVPAGPVTGHVLNTAAVSNNFTPGDLAYIRDGLNSGIYRITSINPLVSITIDSIFPATGSMSSPNVLNTVPGFTNTERQNLSSLLYQPILNSLTSTVASLITEWQGKIDSQITQLGLQNDTRALQISQNAAALTDANDTKSIITTWQALPNTGVGAKYTNAGLAPIQAEMTARLIDAPARVVQIVTALGSVAQSGNSYSGVVNSSYYNRYKWLNIRINKQSGSARRYFAAADGAGSLSQLIADNTAVKNEYDVYFLTKRITTIDTTPIVILNNNQGFVNGDIVTVLSETQPEIQRVIVEVMGTNQLKLNTVIPNVYQLGDVARLFKTL